MMLSSLEAPAIISVRIEGIPHEYMAIEGIVEDMTNIILNLKGALLRKLPTDDNSHARETRFITTELEITREDLDQNEGHYPVTLGDIVQDGVFEVVNPELHLFTVTKPMKRQIDLRVATGRGYVPSERHGPGEGLSDLPVSRWHGFADRDFRDARFRQPHRGQPGDAQLQRLYG